MRDSLANWLKKFKKHSTSSPVAISFNTNSIAIAQINSGNDEKINLKIAATESFSGNNLKKELKRIVKKYNISLNQCILALHPSQYQVLLENKPDVEDSEVDSAIKWTIKDELPYSLDDSVTACIDMPKNTNKLVKEQVFVIVSQKSWINKTLRDLHMAPLKVEVISVSDISLRKITNLYFPDPESSTLILNIEKGVGKLLVIFSKEIYVIRKLKLFSDDSGVNINDVETIASDISNSMSYCESILNIPQPANILFTADDFYQPFYDILSKSIETPIKKIDIAEFFNTPDNKIINQNPLLLISIGALLQEQL